MTWKLELTPISVIDFDTYKVRGNEYRLFFLLGKSNEESSYNLDFHSINQFFLKKLQMY
jgi:hypothetical protein